MFDTIDALIATVGVVFVLSLVVQAIQQIIKQLFSFKSRYMEKELLAMFGAEGPTLRGKKVETSALAAPIAAKLARWTAKNKHIVQIIDALKKKLAGFGYNDLSLLERVDLTQFLKFLGEAGQGLLEKADENLKAALTKAADDAKDWYDFTLKAFQDHYERRMKLWAYVISFVLVAMLNVDLFDVFGEFQSDRVLRESAVAATEAIISSYRTDDSGAVAETPASLRDLRSSVGRQITIVDSLVSIRSFQLWRWDRPGRDTLTLGNQGLWDVVGNLLNSVGRHFPGMLLMSLLVGLGAPFWYDILKAVMGLKQRAQPPSDGAKHP